MKVVLKSRADGAGVAIFAENAFYDRFPFGEPPIASVPSWVTKEVNFTSYPDPLARAKAIYLNFEGSKSIMGHEGFLREYKSYQVSPEQEALWQAACSRNQ